MSPHAIDCARASRLLGAWHDGELPEDDRDLFEQHLLICPTCLHLKDNLQVALAAFRRVAEGG